nr:hypothetical protein [Mycoplasmopsis bovis]
MNQAMMKTIYEKLSVWFTLKGIFKNGLEESDFEIEVDKDKKSLTIKATKDLKNTWRRNKT